MYHLDPDAPTPLHIQLYEAIKEEITARNRVGDKLPSIRRLATLYNLSKTTVEAAYSQLYAEGYIESRPRSGYYVSDFHFAVRSDPPPETPAPSATPAWRYDFFPAQLNSADFPHKLWRRLCSKTLSEMPDFGSYGDGQGEWELREAIADYLTDARGVACTAEQIVITHGFADAMGLVAKLAKPDYTHFGHESPGYHIAWRVFGEYGYTVHPIPVGAKGIDLDALRQSPAQILYITPSHQYPTGVTLPVSERLRLLEYIDAIGGLLIEDDYDSELTYTTRPIPALQGLDRHDRVVYLGTFAKSLSPAIRVGYMVLPRLLMDRFRAGYDAHFPRVSLTTQLTLARFLSGGHYDRHVRRIRTLNRKKHNRMKALFARELGSTYTILSEGGGLAILIMPTVPFDWERFRTEAVRQRIKLYFAAERSGGDFEAIRMGFGGFGMEELDEAVTAFGEIWRGCLV